MRKYDFQKIDKLLQPVMEMMREEFPNDCKLIVGADFSQIVFEHIYLTFPSDDMKKPLCEAKHWKDSSSSFKDILDTLKNKYEEIKNTEESGE